MPNMPYPTVLSLSCWRETSVWKRIWWISSLIPARNAWRAHFCCWPYGKQGQPQKLIAKVSQEMLAEMIGTTRSRVNVFMNKFKKLGFIHYNGGLHINNS